MAMLAVNNQVMHRPEVPIGEKLPELPEGGIRHEGLRIKSMIQFMLNFGAFEISRIMRYPEFLGGLPDQEQK
jgi:hypothetical protein